MELYYYTTTDTLRYILENGDIFATNIRYMNDSEEYTNGLEELHALANNDALVERWIEERRPDDIIKQEEIKALFTKEKLEECKKQQEYYSISFCQKNDLLSQWAIYARESGVSIKMNFVKESYCFWAESTEKEGVGDKKTDKAEKRRAEWQLIPKEVCYLTHDSMKGDEKEYEEKAFDILDQLYTRDAVDKTEGKSEIWRYISTYVKRYDFYQESESRLIFQPGQAFFPPKIKYRCDNKVLKPYLDVYCKGGWPIWEIMIGPGFNQEVVYNSVKHFLEHMDVMAGLEDNSWEYIKRVENYFKTYAKELEGCKAYDEMCKYISDNELISKMSFDYVKIVFYRQTQQICRSIVEEQYGEELQEYVKRNYFTKSGIILSKTSIPYIF